ncbi:glycerol-3-phosphate acyltransferase, partial [Candidatus Bathyarchaeota archaeon]|nr:glycerol-3-phosphate acyltransferase [Candidatus Bathyarchaeota archaeon]
MQIYIILFFSYMIGSFSFSRLILKFFRKKDSFKNLSINVNGTNERVNIIGGNTVSMILGPKIGLFTSLLDALKTIIPMYILKITNFPIEYYLIFSIGSLIGHVWPIYYNFKGGRGASTLIGSFLVVDFVGLITSLILGFVVGFLGLSSPGLAFMGWLLFMLPWVFFVKKDFLIINYSILLILIYFLANLPEILLLYKYIKIDGSNAYMDSLY